MERPRFIQSDPAPSGEDGNYLCRIRGERLNAKETDMSTLKTEEEARDMRCCGSGICGEIHEDQPNMIAHDRCCIAAHCMAWRWMGSERPDEPATGAEWLRTGYCGLAGVTR